MGERHVETTGPAADHPSSSGTALVAMRSTTARVVAHASAAPRGSLTRTWLVPRPRRPMGTPGSRSPGPAARALAAPPSVTTLGEADHQLAVLAGERRDAGGLRGEPQPRHVEQPLHGRRQRPEAVDQLAPHRRQLGLRDDPAQSPVQLQLLGLLGHVVVGQEGVDGQVDDRLRSGSGWAGRSSRAAFSSSTASASIRVYRSKPTAAMWPCCSAPRMLPAPRISRSASAIWNPAPSSDALNTAWSRLRAMSESRSRRRYSR